MSYFDLSLEDGIKAGEFGKDDVWKAMNYVNYFYEPPPTEQSERKIAEYLTALVRARDNVPEIKNVVDDYADLKDLARRVDCIEDYLETMSNKDPLLFKEVSKYFDLDEWIESKERDDEDIEQFTQPEGDDFSLPVPEPVFEPVVEPVSYDIGSRLATLSPPITVEDTQERAIDMGETQQASTVLASSEMTPGEQLPKLDLSIQKKQFDLLSGNINAMLSHCVVKFTMGKTFFETYFKENEKVLHSDISPKIFKSLLQINKEFFEKTVKSLLVDEVLSQEITSIVIKTIGSKYVESLKLVELLTSAVNKLHDIFVIACEANNVGEVNQCIETSSELLNICAALGSKLHLTEITISNKYYEFLGGLFINENLKEIGVVAVKGLGSVASILDPYNIVVSIKTIHGDVEFMSLDCAPYIEEKIKILKDVFTQSGKPPSDDDDDDEPPSDEPPSDEPPSGKPPSDKPPSNVPLDPCTFESLFFAEDGKTGEFLEICALHGLKYTTLNQKAGRSHMPIQVGTENLMKMNSKSLDCFMNVYNFVAWWCNNADEIKRQISDRGISETWVDDVAKELLSLLFKFIQFNDKYFVVNQITFSEGKKNLCPAPKVYMHDLRPDSLDSEITNQNENRIKISLYENPKSSNVFSYDEFADALNKGHAKEIYSKHLNDVNETIFDKKKELRDQIKELKKTRGLKGGGPKAAKGKNQPTPAEQLQRLEEQLEQIKSSEKLKTNTAELKDDAENFILIPVEKELPWETFKKYFENYIVNFCREEQPSLKMTTFLKMMHLNALMVRLGWGFIDLAGGSLMNFLQRRFVVTADYDDKIYFKTIDEFGNVLTPEELIRRQTYIKMCMINMGIEINNYMIKNDFFGNAKIKAQFSFKHPSMAQPIPLDLLTILLETLSKRPFGSRGKEPELFPVPLYSSDMFWSVKLLWVNRRRDLLERIDALFQRLGDLYAENLRSPTDDLRGQIAELEREIAYLLKMFKSDGFTMSIGYEDLVFKTLDKHFLYKKLMELGKSHEEAMRIIFSTFVSPYNFDPAADPSTSTMGGSRWFALRIPSLYEIEYDILSMLTEPELKNARMAVGKSGKDVTRKDVVNALKRLLIDKENAKRGLSGESPLVTDQEKEDFFMRYPIASTFVDKILLYFQTDLFQICCKRVKFVDVKMRDAMILPPLGVISNGTNNMIDPEKNAFLLPPNNINRPRGVIGAGPQIFAPLEITQVMRSAVLYAYNSISNIFMTQICLTKKYGEFKSATDFERARHFLEINFTALANGEISFDLFNYELWISRGKLQSPIPFKNCYAATFGRASNSLKYSSTIYDVALAGMKRLNVTALPQFKQLVEGVKTIDGNNAESPPPYKTGVIDEIPVAKKDINNTFIKNTTAETVAAKLELSKLKPLYGVQGGTFLDAAQTSIDAAKQVPTETLPSAVAPLSTAVRARSRGLVRAAPVINDFTSRLIGEPQAVFAGGGNKRHPTLTRKRSSQSSSSLLLFTKRNRHPNHQSLKQKKRTIKKGSRKKRPKKSIKKRV
jgi:hypothetical protein